MRKLQAAVPFIILTYIIFAFVWWTILLNRTIHAAHEAEVAHLATRLTVLNNISSPAELPYQPEYQRLVAQFHRQERMLFGESILLGLSILMGVLFVYRILRDEISAAKQQRNFLLSITHELKSPIAGIRLILETFQKRRELPAATQIQLSTNALNETDRLTTLVNDLLLSAKLETSYHLNYEQVDIADVVQESAEIVVNKYPGAKISLDIAPELPKIRADRTALFSVAINLIENAAKYSQPSPEIVVNLHLNGHKELLLSVADNGIGIADTEKRKIWGKFYRIGSEDTRQTKGTGLGLYIVRQLVKLHGGIIQLKDNSPRGTIFFVSLPL